MGDATRERPAWRWVPLWVSKSVVVLELLGQVRVLEAKNALLERERAVALHQLDWFAQLVTELRQREAALFLERYGVTLPAPQVEVSAETASPPPAPAAGVPAQVSVRDVMGKAREMIDRAGQPPADPFADEADGMFDDVGDRRADELGLTHDDEGQVISGARGSRPEAR